MKFTCLLGAALVVFTVSCLFAPAATYQTYANGGWTDIEEFEPDQWRTVVWHTSIGSYPIGSDDIYVRNHQVGTETNRFCYNLYMSGTNARVDCYTMLRHYSLHIGHNLYWTNGSFEYGHFYVSNSISMDADNYRTLAIGAHMHSYGPVTHSAGHLHLSRSYWHIEDGSIYDLSWDGSNVSHYGALENSGRIYNYGTFRKSAGTGTSIVDCYFWNLGGTIDVQTGDLILRSSGESSNGILQVAAGSELDLTGGHQPRYCGTYSGDGEGYVVLSGGAFREGSEATMALTNGGFHWRGGVIGSDSTYAGLRNEEHMVIAGTAMKELGMNARIYNADMLIQSNAGPMHLTRSRVYNYTGAVWRIMADGSNVTHYGGLENEGRIYNYGVFGKYAGTGTSVIDCYYYNLGGTVEVASGTMVLYSSGISSDGVFNVSDGCLLDITGGREPAYHGVFTGPGSGTVQFAAGAIAENSDVTFSIPDNGLTWCGGSIKGILRNTEILNPDGESVKTIGGQLHNSGTIIHDAPGPIDLNRGYLFNASNGLFEIDGTGTNISGYTPYSEGFIQNNGTFRKVSSGDSYIDVEFRQRGGLFEIQAGTLHIYDNSYDSMTQSGGVTRLSGGDLSVSGDDYFLQAGILEGTGTLTVAEIENYGTVAPGLSTGTLNIQGNYLQRPEGTLNIELGGTESCTAYDQLRVSGSAHLNGTLNVSLTNGYVPQVLDTFTLITCGTRAGVFAVTNLPSLSTGQHWRVIYTNDAVHLLVAGTVRFATNSYAVPENAGTADILIERVGTTNRKATARCATADGSAVAGLDYTAITGDVVIAHGCTSGTFPVTIIDNSLVDARGTVLLSLATDSLYYRIGTPGNAVLNITEDEVLTPASLPYTEDFESGSPDTCWVFNSAESGRIQITTNFGPIGTYHMTMDSTAYALNEAVLHLDLAGAENVCVSFMHRDFGDEDDVMSASFTGTENADGVAISADGTNWYKMQGLISADGVTYSYRRFHRLLDTVVSSNGLTYNSDFQIKFQQYDNLGLTADGFGFDNISAFIIQGEVGLGTNIVSAAENSGVLDISVIRTNAAYPADVTYTTADGTAVAGQDYTATNGILHMGVGVTNISIPVALINNTEINGVRTFAIRLTGVDSPYTLGATSTGTVNIIDDEVWTPAGLPFADGFESGDLSNCWMTYADHAGRIQVTTNWWPDAGDYHVTMDSSESSAYSLNELTLLLDLTGQSNVILQFRQREYGDENDVMSTYFSGHENADGVAISTNGTDWYRLQGLTSTDGVSSTYRTFSIDLDAVATSHGIMYSENVQVKFQQYDNWYIDSDGFAFDEIEVFASPGAFFLGTNAYTLDEAGTRTVEVFRSTGGGTASVAYATANGSARAGFEYTSATGRLDFAAGQTNTAAVLTAIDNDTPDLNDTFSFALADPGDYYHLSAPFLATVTITGEEQVIAAPFPLVDGFESGILSNWWTLYSSAEGRVELRGTNDPYAGAWHLTMDSATTNYALNEAMLTIDLAGQSNVWLGFRHRHFNDDLHIYTWDWTGHHNHDGVAISTNGETWHTIQHLVEVCGTSTNWQRFAIDLDNQLAEAGYTYSDTFQIKFQQYDNAPIPNAGFAFDDVMLYTPTGMITYATDTLTVAESSGAVTVSVIRTGSRAGEASISFQTIGNSAEAGLDFAPTNGVLAFADGVGTVNVTIAILDDDIQEAAETFGCYAWGPSGVYAYNPTQAVEITITDTDTAPVAPFPLHEDFESGSFSNWWIRYATGAGALDIVSDFGPAQGTRHLVMEATDDVTDSLNELEVCLDLAGQTNVWLKFLHKDFDDSTDYMSGSFTGHENSDGVAVSADGTNWYRAQGLTEYEGICQSYRPFTVSLDDVCATNGIGYTDRFHIRFQQYGDDEVDNGGFAFDEIIVTTPQDHIGFTNASLAVAEDSGMARLAVVRTNASTQVQVAYTTAPIDAVSGQDYSDSSGTLVFSNGMTCATIEVAIANNTWVDFYARSFQVTLSDPSGYAAFGPEAGCTVSITDDESPAAASIPFREGFERAMSNCWARYTSGGHIEITTNWGPHSGQAHLVMDSDGNVEVNEVILSLDLAGHTNVWLTFWHKHFDDEAHGLPAVYTNHYNGDGTAISQDGIVWYRLRQLTGNISENYRVFRDSIDPVISANGLAYTHPFYIKFQQYDNASISADGFAFDDIQVFEPRGFVQFAAATASVTEGEARISMDVQRTGSVADTLSVPFTTTAGSATADDDYDATGGTADFGDGISNVTIHIDIIDDTVFENTETFMVQLLTPTNGLPGTITTAVVNIIDNERSRIYTNTLNTGLPTGWSITTNQGAAWRFDDPAGRDNLTGGTGVFAIADSDYAGGVTMDTELRSAPMDFTGMARVYLYFRTDFYCGSDEIADVDISTNGPVGPWINIRRQTGINDRGPLHTCVNITDYAAHRDNIMIRFRYHNALYDWWWQVDDIVFTGEPDDDGDTVPDWWETYYYDGPTNCTVTADDDDDGSSNDDEYIADTDPHDADSLFRFSAMGHSTSVMITFTTSASRVYSVDYSGTGPDGPWLHLRDNISGTGADLSVFDTNSNPAQIYRARVSRP
jgi:hypothetical protein